MPVPVFLNRFAAARFVFIFGMVFSRIGLSIIFINFIFYNNLINKLLSIYCILGASRSLSKRIVRKKIDGATNRNLGLRHLLFIQKKAKNGRKKQKMAKNDRSKQITVPPAKKHNGASSGMQGDVIILFSGSIVPF